MNFAKKPQKIALRALFQMKSYNYSKKQIIYYADSHLFV